MVTREEFKRIKCNRCGECCQRFSLGGLSPLELAGEWYRDPPGSIDVSIWFGNLVPTQHSDGVWTYACSFFRPAEGRRKAACIIHSRRPSVCRDFPYGEPAVHYPHCAWNVRLRSDGEALAATLREIEA